MNSIFLLVVFTSFIIFTLVYGNILNANVFAQSDRDGKDHDRDGKDHDRDGKDHDRDGKRSYDIKVTINNPDRLDTERDVKVRTSIDSEKKEIHLVDKTEKTTFKNIKGYSDKKVTACIEGSNHIRGDCETERLTYHDDSVSIKLKIESS